MKVKITWIRDGITDEYDKATLDWKLRALWVPMKNRRMLVPLEAVECVTFED